MFDENKIEAFVQKINCKSSDIRCLKYNIILFSIFYNGNDSYQPFNAESAQFQFPEIFPSPIQDLRNKKGQYIAYLYEAVKHLTPDFDEEKRGNVYRELEKNDMALAYLAEKFDLPEYLLLSKADLLYNTLLAYFSLCGISRCAFLPKAS